MRVSRGLGCCKETYLFSSGTLNQLLKEESICQVRARTRIQFVGLQTQRTSLTGLIHQFKQNMAFPTLISRTSPILNLWDVGGIPPPKKIIEHTIREGLDGGGGLVFTIH